MGESDLNEHVTKHRVAFLVLLYLMLGPTLEI